MLVRQNITALSTAVKEPPSPISGSRVCSPVGDMIMLKLVHEQDSLQYHIGVANSQLPLFFQPACKNTRTHDSPCSPNDYHSFLQTNAMGAIVKASSLTSALSSCKAARGGTGGSTSKNFIGEGVGDCGRRPR